MKHSPTSIIISWLFLFLLAPIWAYAGGPSVHSGKHQPAYFFSCKEQATNLWEGRWNGVRVYISKSDIRFSWIHAASVAEIHSSNPMNRLGKVVSGSALFLDFPRSLPIEPEPLECAKFMVNVNLSTSSFSSQAWRGWQTRNLWPGVDYRVEVVDEALKSTFYLRAGVDPEVVRWRYQGAKSLKIEQDKLLIETEDGRMEEQHPLVYQMINGKRKEIPASFHIQAGEIGFRLLQPYDNRWPLVLDPTLVFVSYSGSISDNWGYTATPGPDGRLYSGGVAFGAGFPVTPGAFQTTFRGGSGTGLRFDAALLAFSPNGDSLIWASYLGGSGNEQPHSMVVNFSDSSLYVMGTTNSPDFPKTPQGWDTSYNGGNEVFVVRFSADGALLNATFLGGSGDDGYNEPPSLTPNYGDWYRGEIILDHQGNVVVGSCTKSPDFPKTSGGFSAGPRAGQDGFVSVFSPQLNQLLTSVVIGAEGEEAVFSIKPLPQPSTSLALGMVTTGNLPIVGQTVFRQKPGFVDGYVAVLSGDGKNLRASSWFGSASNDWVFFVESGPDGSIYLNGQTTGDVPRAGNCYHVPNSGQFIACFDSSLTQLRWSGNYGSGRDTVDMVPTAFLVDDCGKVYISGSTGKISLPQIIGPTNLPLTADSIMGSANGYDFYMACWSAGYDSLLYATYYGGPISQEHVDGGTSRFDKKGVIYQSVCAGCGGRSDFPVSSGTVVSPVNRALNCNNAVIKLAFEQSNPLIPDFSFTGNQPLCPPFLPPIANVSTTLPGTSWLWTTSDGQQSTDSIPAFIFSQPGKYSITLRATNPLNCNVSASVSKSLTINSPPASFLTLSDTCICNGTPFSLEVPSQYPVFQWVGTSGINNRNLSILASGTYILQVSDSNGCSGKDSVTVQVLRCQGDEYNVFTPNEDGKNDEFHPLPELKADSYFEIHNRWGQRVFETTSVHSSWNGRYFNTGAWLEEAIYFYRIKTTLCGQPKEWYGRVMLLR